MVYGTPELSVVSTRCCYGAKRSGHRKPARTRGHSRSSFGEKDLHAAMEEQDDARVDGSLAEAVASLIVVAQRKVAHMRELVRAPRCRAMIADNCSAELEAVRKSTNGSPD